MNQKTLIAIEASDSQKEKFGLRLQWNTLLTFKIEVRLPLFHLSIQLG